MSHHPRLRFGKEIAKNLILISFAKIRVSMSWLVWISYINTKAICHKKFMLGRERERGGDEEGTSP